MRRKLKRLHRKVKRRVRRLSVYDRITSSTRRAAKKIKHEIKHATRRESLMVGIAFAIAAMVMIGALILSYIAPYIGLQMTEPVKSDDEIARTCEIDADCVPDSCCHAFRCVNNRFGPSCSGIGCTEDCKPGTMDCGNGYCACTAGLCEAYILNPK